MEANSSTLLSLRGSRMPWKCVAQCNNCYKLLLGRQTKAQLSSLPWCLCREEKLLRSTHSNSTSMVTALYQGHCSQEQRWNKARKKTNFKSYRLSLSFQYKFHAPPHYMFIHSVKFLRSLYYLFQQLVQYFLLITVHAPSVWVMLKQMVFPSMKHAFGQISKQRYFFWHPIGTLQSICALLNFLETWHVWDYFARSDNLLSD